MIYPNKGYIGCFEMIDKVSGKRQLEGYIQQLKDAGHQQIIAPVNGDTWHQYRLVTWSNGGPAFPFEPQNPLWYNEVYEELGFKPLMKYRSDKFNINNIKPIENQDLAFIIRDFCDTDLRLIYDISLQSFDENFLYNDITFEEFAKLYKPILPMIDRELVVIAEVEGVPAGFMFSFIAGDTQILKSMAVLPEFRSRGVGAKLINHVLLAGKGKGAKIAIAALMSDGNNSMNIISKYDSEQIREYTLYHLNI
jgi:GNAT superfamily N-acetyltransferase